MSFPPAPRVVVEQALLLVERAPAHPASPALHAALSRWLETGASVDRAAFAAVLAANPAHPSADGLRRLLSGFAWLPAPSVEEVLAMDGALPAGADPVAEVERRLRRAREARAVLEARIGVLEGELAVARRRERLALLTAVGAGLLAAVLGLALAGAGPESAEVSGGGAPSGEGR